MIDVTQPIYVLTIVAFVIGLIRMGKKLRIKMGPTMANMMLGEGSRYSIFEGQKVVPKRLKELGFILGYGYTGPPIGYKYLGLGEVGVFFSAIAASEFISVAATGHFYLSSILFFIPFSLLIVLILFIGNVRDIEFDQKAGLNTLAVLLGRRKSEVFSVVIFVFFYFISAVLYLLKVYSRFTPVILITIPFAIYLSFRWTRKESVNYERTAGPYLFGISMLLVALLVL